MYAYELPYPESERPEVCVRCGGRMTDAEDNDRKCRNCGHVDYADAPEQHRGKHEPWREYVVPQDTGCAESETCVTCPLPQCKYDEPLWWATYQRERRDKRVVADLKDTQSPRATARRLRISERTVYRAVRRVVEKRRRDAQIDA